MLFSIYDKQYDVDENILKKYDYFNKVISFDNKVVAFPLILLNRLEDLNILNIYCYILQTLSDTPFTSETYLIHILLCEYGQQSPSDPLFSIDNIIKYNRYIQTLCKLYPLCEYDKYILSIFPCENEDKCKDNLICFTQLFCILTNKYCKSNINGVPCAIMISFGCKICKKHIDCKLFYWKHNLSFWVDNHSYYDLRHMNDSSCSYLCDKIDCPKKNLTIDVNTFGNWQDTSTYNKNILKYINYEKDLTDILHEMTPSVDGLVNIDEEYINIVNKNYIELPISIIHTEHIFMNHYNEYGDLFPNLLNINLFYPSHFYFHANHRKYLKYLLYNVL